MGHKDWTLNGWDEVGLLVRRKPGEAYKPDCLARTVNHRGGSVMDGWKRSNANVCRANEPGQVQVYSCRKTLSCLE